MSNDEPLFAHGIAHVGDLVRCAPSLIQEILVEGLDGKLGKLAAAAKHAGIPCRQAGRTELVRYGGREARAALAMLEPYPYVGLDDLLGTLPGEALVVALDGVTDPGNLGAIVRSAVFFGASALILPERNCATVSSVVVRRSAGAVMQLPVARVTNLVRSLRRLQEAGFWVYGTSPTGATELSQEVFASRSCLVLGSEGTGMRPLVSRSCDAQLSLAGQFESLNVAGFAAVLFYQWASKKNLDNP